MENLCCNRGFDVATELAKARRNYVATELAAIENSATHDRAGMLGLGAPRHALGMHSTKAHDRGFCCDREFSVATDFT